MVGILEKTDIASLSSEWSKDYSAFSELRIHMKEDYAIYTGDHWRVISRNWLDKFRKRSKLVINFTKKTVDVMVGYEIQNRTDIMVIPIEGADNETADILFQTMKWITARRSYKQQATHAMKDAYIGGLGWLHVSLDSQKDPLNKDIRILRVDPRDILIDPMTQNPDLSDCSHLYRYAYVQRDDAMLNWDEKASEISKLKAEKDARDDRDKTYDAKDSINIIEKWYRKSEKRKFLVDTESNKVMDYEGDTRDFRDQYIASQQGRIIDESVLSFQTRYVSKVKLLAGAGDKVELYNGDAPAHGDVYPFFPLWGYYTPGEEKWEWRVQGIVRALKDINLEKDKRRSQHMDIVSSAPLGWTVTKDSDITPEKMKEPGIKVFRVQSHDEIAEIPQARAWTSFLEEERLLDIDALRVGPNADALGVIEGGSAPSASGVAQQQRIKQTLTSLQEPLDHKSMTYESMGRYIVHLINTNFKREKIERICGENLPYVKELKEISKEAVKLKSAQPQTEEEQQQMMQQTQQLEQRVNFYRERYEELWQKFDNSRNSAEYDCEIQEIQHSPSYKMAVGAQLMDLEHQGKRIPTKMLAEYMQISPKSRQDWIAGEEAAQQSAMQVEQAKMEHEKELVNIKGEWDLKIKQLEIEAKLKEVEMKEEGGLEKANIKEEGGLLKEGLKGAIK